MTVTCAVCGRTFNNIGAMADHISETNRGIQGDIFAGMNMPELARDPQEMDQLMDSLRGFAHIRYYDRNGRLLIEPETTILYVTLTAGAKWCTDCRASFANNIRLFEHYFSTGHGDRDRERAIEEMQRFREFEAKWF